MTLINKAVKAKAIQCIKNFKARDCTKTADYVAWTGGKVCMNGAIAKCFGAPTLLPTYRNYESAIEMIRLVEQKVEHSREIAQTIINYFGRDFLFETNSIHQSYASRNITFKELQKQTIKLIKELKDSTPS